MTEASIRKADLRQMLLGAGSDAERRTGRSGRAHRASIDVRDKRALRRRRRGISRWRAPDEGEALARIDEASLARPGRWVRFEASGNPERHWRPARSRTLQACEEKREQEQGRARRLTGRSAGFSLFSNAGGS